MPTLPVKWTGAPFAVNLLSWGRLKIVENHGVPMTPKSWSVGLTEPDGLGKLRAHFSRQNRISQ